MISSCQLAGGGEGEPEPKYLGVPFPFFPGIRISFQETVKNPGETDPAFGKIVMVEKNSDTENHAVENS